MSRKGLFLFISYFVIVAKKGSYQNKLFLSLWSTMIYIDPSQTAESLGACVTWCIRLMSEKEFLELVSTILDPSVWQSVPETAEDKHQQFVFHFIINLSYGFHLLNPAEWRMKSMLSVTLLPD